MATGIGETLREARRRRGQTLADAAASTRVRESHLAALEEEQFGALGSEVYVIGFLRSYARFLQLDDDAVIDRYRRAAAPDDASPPLDVPERRPIAGPGPARLVLALIAAAVLIALLLSGLREGAGAVAALLGTGAAA